MSMGNPTHVSGGMGDAFVAMLRSRRSADRDPRCFVLTGSYEMRDGEPVFVAEPEDSHLRTCGICNHIDVDPPLTARMVTRHENGRPA